MCSKTLIIMKPLKNVYKSELRRSENAIIDIVFPKNPSLILHAKCSFVLAANK